MIELLLLIHSVQFQLDGEYGYMRLESRGRSVPILHYKKELAELMLEFNTFSSLCYVTICDPFYTSKIISVIFIDRLLSICTVI